MKKLVLCFVLVLSMTMDILVVNAFSINQEDINEETSKKLEESTDFDEGTIIEENASLIQEANVQVNENNPAIIIEIPIESENESEFCLLVMEDSEQLNETLDIIDKIKNNDLEGEQVKEFLSDIDPVINTENESTTDFTDQNHYQTTSKEMSKLTYSEKNKQLHVYSFNKLATKYNETGSSYYTCAATLRVTYDYQIMNGKGAYLLKSVKNSIVNSTSVAVTGYAINYGCSGVGPDGSRNQTGYKTYGAIGAGQSGTVTITCPSTWKYIYKEGVVSKMGANVNINVRRRTSSGYYYSSFSLSSNM